MSTKPYRPCAYCRGHSPPDRVEGVLLCRGCRATLRKAIAAEEAAEAFRARLAVLRQDIEDINADTDAIIAAAQ